MYIFQVLPLIATYNPALHQILFENRLSLLQVHAQSTSSKSGRGKEISSKYVLQSTQITLPSWITALQFGTLCLYYQLNTLCLTH